jgi:Bacterial protein of unknown function (DUF839)
MLRVEPVLRDEADEQLVDRKPHETSDLVAPLGIVVQPLGDVGPRDVPAGERVGFAAADEKLRRRERLLAEVLVERPPGVGEDDPILVGESEDARDEAANRLFGRPGRRPVPRRERERRLRRGVRAGVGVRHPRRDDLAPESPGKDVLDLPDNITVSPRRKSVLLCEDSTGDNFLRGLTQDGQLFDFALNRFPGAFGDEFAGATFSPNTQTLFVNLQATALTYAIWGPWERGLL